MQWTRMANSFPASISFLTSAMTGSKDRAAFFPSSTRSGQPRNWYWTTSCVIWGSVEISQILGEWRQWNKSSKLIKLLPMLLKLHKRTNGLMNVIYTLFNLCLYIYMWAFNNILADTCPACEIVEDMIYLSCKIWKDSPTTGCKMGIRLFHWRA